MFACLFEIGDYSPATKTTSQQDAAPVSLLELAYSFSPLVENTTPNTVVIDIDGGGLLFGSASDLAASIIASARELGLHISVALAADADAAIHIARNSNGIRIVPEGEEQAYLAPLPLSVLDFSLAGVEQEKAKEILATLELWGIGSFGEFGALPEKGVAERLGQEGLKLQRMARGTSHRRLEISKVEPKFEYEIELEHQIKELEPLSFVLSRLLSQLCASLDASALATNELCVQLKLESGNEYLRSINLPVPMRDHMTFLRLLLLDIEIEPPASPVAAIRIGCKPVKPRVLQSGLFEPVVPEPEKLELTLARIARLVGAENVGSPEPVNTHRPDAFLVKRFRPGIRRKRKDRKSERRQRSIGFRVFRPPLAAEVDAMKGRPCRISAKDSERRMRGKIVRMAGPWRTTGDWWSGSRWARDEWDIAIKDQSNGEALYRIFRELHSGEWFVEGMYD
jgi:protein ImuB